MVTMCLLHFQSSHPLSGQEEGDGGCWPCLLSQMPLLFPFPEDFSSFYGLELGHMATVSARDPGKQETGVVISLD